MRGEGMFPNEDMKNQANDLLKEPMDKEVAEYIKQRIMEEIVEYVVFHQFCHLKYKGFRGKLHAVYVCVRP